MQHVCIPQAILGMNVLYQAGFRVGKTAAFVLASLQQIDASEEAVWVLVVCRTRELAYQFRLGFDRLAKFIPGGMAGVVYDGVPVA